MDPITNRVRDDVMKLTITPVVEALIGPVMRCLGIWISSPKYVKAMDAKMKRLEDTIEEVQDKRDTAVANTEVVPKHVETWLEDVKKIIDKAKCIQTDRIGFFNALNRYDAGKKSSDILKEIEDLETRESKFKFTKDKISLAMVPSTSKQPSTSTLVLDGTQNSFTSRDALFNDALKSLMSSNEAEKMIALCGTGGVGKTTLMEQLSKVLKASRVFDWVVKVEVGESKDIFALQQAIAEYIRLDLTEKDKSARAERLHKSFEGMSQQGQNKILVIIDDIWKEVDLKDVGLTDPLPNGFKLLLTSRFEYVCSRMGVKNDSIFRVDVLNDLEAKDLFFGIVEQSLLDDDCELQKIGEDIVKKCGGLPIALKTIANNLRGGKKDAWKEVLSNLQHDDLRDLHGIVHKVFEISYNNLQRDDDKAIFLLSGLFPDDVNIPIEELMKYGWGLNLFVNEHTLANARRRTNTCINNLIQANLLIESEFPGYVKMHDLMRAFVLSNFANVKQASILSHDNMSGNQLTTDACESYERILLRCNNMAKFPINFNYPNLSLLIIMVEHKFLKFPEDIFERTKELEVISYVNMSISLLSVRSEHLAKLRTLCFYSCSLVNDDLLFLGSLSNLEILSFADCNIRRLPITIGKLKKLRLLDLSGCVDLCVDDGVLQNLSGLEELYITASIDHSIRFTKANYDELAILSHQLFALELELFENAENLKNMSFKNLKRFRISIGCKLIEIEEDQMGSFKNTVQFVGDYNELLECQICEVFEKTEILHLEVNDMNCLEDYSFYNLTALYVSECTDLTCLFTVDMVKSLKKLERLTISECHVMRTLVAENSRVGVIRFQNLKYMSLTNLPEMVSFWDNVIEFPEMVELIVDGLPNFTSIYPHNHDTSEIQALLNKKVVISQLEKLDISRMENLKHIWSCETSNKNNVSMLRKIVVRECDELMNLFPSNPLPLLTHLEELVVKKCGSIEVLFNMELESVCDTGEYNNSKLRRIKVKELENLKEVWRIKCVNKFDVCIKCFKDVESIIIKQCSIFKNLFTPSTINFDLGALRNYVKRNTGEKILKGETSEMDEHLPIVTYPSDLLHMCNHLRHLELYNDERVEEVVFEMDTHRPLLLPYLEVLRLYSLKDMSLVWKCNWDKFLISQHPPLQLPFQNLAHVSVRKCHKIKYLFSPHMATHLSNLKSVDIYDCAYINEVISSRDERNEKNLASTSSINNSMLFPHLETLCLKMLPNLKRIDDQSQSGQVFGACWSLCQYPTTIDVYDCDALSVLIPWYAVREMKTRLQELKIEKCKRMVEVFESESSSNNVDEGSEHDGAATTLKAPIIKKITTLVVPQLSNLKHVRIDKCDLLSHVFTFSALKSLKQLKEMTIKCCNAMQVIVKEEDEMASKYVVFPRLERLELNNLPNLKGFFSGMNEFRCPLLEDVMIADCPKLTMFTRGHSKTPKLKYVHTNFGKCSLECGLNFHGTLNEHQDTIFPTYFSSIPAKLPAIIHNFIEINIKERYVGKTLIRSNSLLQLEKVEKIGLSFCQELEQVFEVVALEGKESQNYVVKIPIPNLKEMELNCLDDLKYLWKSNRSILEFPNLTTVEIYTCGSLKHVFTCSMINSLIHLQNLRIVDSYSIKVIVKEEEKEAQCDGKVNEIMKLPCLKSLQLHGLNRLEGFCSGTEAFSLPALDTLKIIRCPAIKVFTNGHVSTPKLKVIAINYETCYVGEDLNSFLKTKQKDVCKEEVYKF